MDTGREEAGAMIPEQLHEVMRHEGVVAIATQGEDGPHLVNTWNSYLAVLPDGRLCWPAGGMHETEANLARDPRVWITLGSRDVAGRHGPGTGFLITGTAEFVASGPEHDSVKERFGWARAAVVVTVETVAQTL